MANPTAVLAPAAAARLCAIITVPGVPPTTVAEPISMLLVGAGLASIAAV